MKNALRLGKDKGIAERFGPGTQAIFNWKIRGTIPVARDGSHAKDLVTVRVAGDSMGGTLTDGDTVLIERSKRKPDGVFAIHIGDALRIK